VRRLTILALVALAVVAGGSVRAQTDPDAGLIAFVESWPPLDAPADVPDYAKATSVICGVDARGRTYRLSDTSSGTLRGDPAWSPDGRWLAISVNAYVPGASITMVFVPGYGSPPPESDSPSVSPDGKLVAYNSFRWNREIDWHKSFADEGIQTGDPLGAPMIRLRDLATRHETALEPGSQSLAWRGDGALAYVRGVPPVYRANLPFQAEVVVRTPDGRMAVWTSEPDRYEILGWAGQALLVQRSFPGGAPDIVAMAGPSESHVVATSSLFIAISPDGANVLVEPSPAEVDHPRIRLVRVADGSELASLPVEDARDPVTGDHLAFVYGPGDWRGDHAVVASETGLLVLHTGETLQIEQVLRLEDAARPNGSLFEPRFADDRTIVAWGGLPESKPPVAVQYACDRFALSCARSAPAAPTNVPRLVYDLSGGTR
jgi:dipeptidyl aminopeptidase/acylaminoacyl peptidase